MPQPTGLFDGTISLLQRALNIRSVQHQALSANIANADTPHFKAFEVAVEQELRRLRQDGSRLQMVQTQSTHLPVSRPPSDRVRLRTAAAPDFSLRADGNTVDVDRTMGDLAENALKYKTSAQLVSSKLKSLRNVIQGGR
jgi:flagellar basal-body rod protein FlgB